MKTLEPIKQLKEICQAGMAETDTWQDKFIYRRFSIYLTRALLQLNINAMQATWFFFFFGFIPGIAFASSHYLTGALLLQIWYIFDEVDGEIARYRKETSISGAYFDNIIHYVIHPFIFVGIGYGLYNDYGDISLLLFSVSAAISIMLLSVFHDLKNSILFALKKEGSSGKDLNPGGNKALGFLKSAFSLLHRICTYPTLINIITLTIVAGIFLKEGLLKYFIIFYGTVIPVLFISKLFVSISERRLDR